MEMSKFLFLNSDNAMSGSRARRSASTNSALATAVATSRPMMVGEVHACSLPPHKVASGGHERHGAADVERRPLRGAARFRQEDGGDDDGGQRERHVEPERPAPAHRVGEESAQQRAGQHGHGVGHAHDAEVERAAARRHHVGHDGLREHHEPAAAQALHGAADHEPFHRRGQRARGRARHEQGQRADEQPFAADEVAHLAVQRHGDGGGQHVGRGHPQHAVHAAQLAHDGGQDGGHDGLVQGPHGHRHQKPREHGGDRAPRQRRIGSRESRRTAAARGGLPAAAGDAPLLRLPVVRHRLLRPRSPAPSSTAPERPSSRASFAEGRNARQGLLPARYRR